MTSNTIEHEFQAPTAYKQIDALDLLIILAKRKTIIIRFVTSSILLAAVVAFLLPRVFTARAKILPPHQSQSSSALMLGQLSALTGGAVNVKNQDDVYVSMLQSRTVADALIQRFKLMERYQSKTLTDAREDLEENTRISTSKDGIISVDVDDNNPQVAAAIANGYVDALFELNQTIAITEASQRRLFYEKRLKSAKDDLANAEVELKKTQESTGLIQPSEQAKAIVEGVAMVQAQIAAKQVELSTIKSFATEQNPDLIRLRNEIAALTRQLSRLENNQTTRRGDIQVPTGKVPEAGLEYLRKYRDVKYYETIYEMIAKQFELAKIDEGKNASIIQVLDPALPPEKKSKPKRILIVLIAALASLIVACCLAFILEAFDFIHSDKEYADKLMILQSYLRQGAKLT
jgi:tyrosine-protein kinase Etk/Wzc